MNSPARILLAGWFSFSDKKATFGDVQAMEVVAGWLRAAGYVFDVAGHPAGGVEGLDISQVDPSGYDTLIFICGPWGGGGSPLLKAFAHCHKIGINLSVAEGPHGFDRLYPRDSSTERNPDLVFAASSMAVPVIGIALVHPQPMFRERQRHEAVAAAVEQYVRESGAAVIKLDTLTDNNTAGIASVRQLEALIRRVDVIISSRLHGVVYGLKNGVPVVAIDCIAGGAKVSEQVKALEWPLLLNGDGIRADGIAEAVRQALTSETRRLLGAVQARAASRLLEIRHAFLTDLSARRPS